ncbi:MAG: aspartyl protease family protein [Flavobacteriaceae bacterium]
MNRTFYIFLLVFIQSILLNAQVATIPFEIKDNGHLYLKVKVNNSKEALNFVFDTGATSDLLDKDIAEKMGIKADYQQSVQGTGGSKTYDIATSQKLILPKGIVIRNTNLVFTDLSRFHAAIDDGFVGIVGYSLLRKFITKIDYQKQELVLYKKISDLNTSSYSKIPFRFDRGIPIPQFDISIQLKNGESFTGKILFDSGAGLTLSVNTPYNQENKIRKKSGKSIISKSLGLSKKSISEKVAINSLTIGDFTFKDLAIRISNEESGVSAYDGYLGILGAQIIKRFNIVLDYSTKTLYLKPNSHYGKKFEFPLSGIQLKKSKKGIAIDVLVETSPAFKAGLREGDQILAIDGKTSKQIKVYRDLLKKEGNTITLKVKSNIGELKSITFKLQRLL